MVYKTMNCISRNVAFSLVEMLMALLVASLLMVALAPVMTKKFNEGVVIRGTIEGTSTKYSTIFYEDGEWTVPGGTNMIKIIAIGGGGAGGGSMFGKQEFITGGTFVVPEDVTKLKVFMVGGGGGGASGGAVQATAHADIPTTAIGTQTKTYYIEGNDTEENKYTFSVNVPAPDINEYCKKSGVNLWTCSENTSITLAKDANIPTDCGLKYRFKATACGGGGGGSYSGPYPGSGGYLKDVEFQTTLTTFYVTVGGGGGVGGYGYPIEGLNPTAAGGYGGGGGGSGCGAVEQCGAGKNGGENGGKGGDSTYDSETKIVTATAGESGTGAKTSSGGETPSCIYDGVTYSSAAKGGDGGVWGGGGGGGGMTAHSTSTSGYFDAHGGGGGGGPTTISSESGSGTILFQVGGGGGAGGTALNGVALGGGGGGGGGYGGGGGGGGNYGQYTCTGGKGGDGSIGSNSITQILGYGGGYNGKTGVRNGSNLTGGHGGSGYGGSATDNMISTIFGSEYCNGGEVGASNTVGMRSKRIGRPGALQLQFPAGIAGKTNGLKCAYNNKSNGGGGGGAGQVWFGEIDVNPGDLLEIKVGEGGSGATTYGTAGENGGETSIKIGSKTYTVSGGGGGKYSENSSDISGTAGLGGKFRTTELKNWTDLPKTSFDILKGGENGEAGKLASAGAGGGKGGSTLNKNAEKIDGALGGNTKDIGKNAINYGAGGGGGGGLSAPGGFPGLGGNGGGGYVYIVWGKTGGGGGASGQIIEKTITVAPGSVITMTVGHGGEAAPMVTEKGGVQGYYGSDGGNGTKTTVKIKTGSLNKTTIEALGGLGGKAGTMVHGLGGNFDEAVEHSIKGEDGAIGLGGKGGSITSTICPLLGALLNDNDAGLGGCGGNTMVPLACYVETAGGGAGSSAKRIGGGGGGGYVKNEQGYAGGNGGNGAVIINWQGLY